MNNKFLFSVSTCSFQIEGGRSEGGRTSSIWDEFTKRKYFIPKPGKAEREINSIDVAADFYHKYKVDAKIMSDIGINSFIYNMDWTRMFPKDENYINPAGLQWFDDFFKSFKEKGVKPIPILLHWDTPLWAQLRGGFENKDIVNWFRKYAKACFKYLGKYTDIWYVSDENSTFSIGGYVDGYLPPEKKDIPAFFKVNHILNLCAAVAKEEFEIAKQKGYLTKDSILGIVHDWSPGIPLNEKNNDDLAAVENFNLWFDEFYFYPNYKGSYPQKVLDWCKENNIKFEITNDDLELLSNNKLDFIGWNYYRPTYISSKKTDLKNLKQKKPSETFFAGDFNIVYPNDISYTKWNWVINPDMLSVGAKILKNKYGDIPFMIVENGMGDFDDKSNELILDYDRIEYLSIHLKEVLRAKDDGVNFIGYSLWTYCDIFSPSGGYRKDYGLISVDFNSPIKERKPKASYAWYEQVIKSSGSDLSVDREKLKKELKNKIDNWDIFNK